MSQQSTDSVVKTSTARGGSELFLGFDYGTRRIGLAVGDRLTGVARPLPSIPNHREPDWIALQRVVKDWRPAACIVGLPLDLDGKDQSMTVQARAFAKQLSARFAMPVHLCDERLSSRSADDELRNARADGRMTRRIKPGDRDGVAARLILEQWLASPSEVATAAPAAENASSSQ
jgi:putative Holliday junction resolvase